MSLAPDALRRLLLPLLGMLLVSSALAAPLRAEETLVFEPDERAGWSIRNLFAVLRPQHFFGPRELHVETVPPGATLDIFYVRGGFQKRYEQADAPVRLVLPRRIDATNRDSVMVRATLDGYRQATARVPISSSKSELVITLDPLPNTLHAVAHLTFLGRDELDLLLDEAPTIRVQAREGGFRVILAETALAPAVRGALEGIRSPQLDGAAATQLGEDLLLEVRFTEAAAREPPELRSRTSLDAARELHRYAIDVVPRDWGARAVERARAALGRLRPEDVSGCALRFDEALRQQLDAAELARALRPRGAFTDPYLRAALRRLGEVSPGGRIELADGSRYRPDVPLEVAAAASQAARARGYLALLRRWVELLEAPAYRLEGLRSLVAPEMSPDAFAAAVDRARAAEAACRSRSAASHGPAPVR